MKYPTITAMFDVTSVTKGLTSIQNQPTQVYSFQTTKTPDTLYPTMTTLVEDFVIIKGTYVLGMEIQPIQTGNNSGMVSDIQMELVGVKSTDNVVLRTPERLFPLDSMTSYEVSVELTEDQASKLKTPLTVKTTSSSLADGYSLIDIKSVEVTPSPVLVQISEDTETVTRVGVTISMETHPSQYESLVRDAMVTFGITSPEAIINTTLNLSDRAVLIEATLGAVEELISLDLVGTIVPWSWVKGQMPNKIGVAHSAILAERPKFKIVFSTPNGAIQTTAEDLVPAHLGLHDDLSTILKLKRDFMPVASAQTTPMDSVLATFKSTFAEFLGETTPTDTPES